MSMAWSAWSQVCSVRLTRSVVLQRAQTWHMTRILWTRFRDWLLFWHRGVISRGKPSPSTVESKSDSMRVGARKGQDTGAQVAPAIEVQTRETPRNRLVRSSSMSEATVERLHALTSLQGQDTSKLVDMAEALANAQEAALLAQSAAREALQAQEYVAERRKSLSMKLAQQQVNPPQQAPAVNQEEHSPPTKTERMTPTGVVRDTESAAVGGTLAELRSLIPPSVDSKHKGREHKAAKQKYTVRGRMMHQVLPLPTLTRDDQNRIISKAKGDHKLMEETDQGPSESIHDIVSFTDLPNGFAQPVPVTPPHADEGTLTMYQSEATQVGGPSTREVTQVSESVASGGADMALVEVSPALLSNEWQPHHLLSEGPSDDIVTKFRVMNSFFQKWKKLLDPEYGWDEMTRSTMTELRRAREAVRRITKSQLQSLQSMPNPPAPVKLVLEAVCLMIHDKLPGPWAEIRRVVRQTSFIPLILRYNPNNMSPALYNQLVNTYLKDPDFAVDVVSRASRTCSPLARWVISQARFRAHALSKQAARVVPSLPTPPDFMSLQSSGPDPGSSSHPRIDTAFPLAMRLGVKHPSPRDKESSSKSITTYPSPRGETRTPERREQLQNASRSSSGGLSRPAGQFPQRQAEERPPRTPTRGGGRIPTYFSHVEFHGQQSAVRYSNNAPQWTAATPHTPSPLRGPRASPSKPPRDMK